MKHAYLIMAHDKFDSLKKLINVLDYDGNDIFIHVDKKNKDWEKHKNDNSIITNKAKLYFVSRKKVFWGGDTQIKCELHLLKNALSIQQYDYYHLLSGADFPIKNQHYIHEFFKKNNGKEFIHFDSALPNEFPDKYNYFYFFQNTSNRILKKVNYKIVGIQKKLNIKRKHRPYYKGANWFSITDNLAGYIVQRENEIKKEFKFTWCCDEVFLQTLVMNSDFKEHLSDLTFKNNSFACLRYIDWDRGQPYVFKEEDFNELIESNFLFARKISNEKHNSLLKKLYKYLSNLQSV